MVTKKKAYEVTEKDYDLINLINRWHYLTIEEMTILTGKAMQTMAWRANRLVELKLLKKKKELISREVYFQGTNPFKLTYYNHDHSVKILANKFSKQYNCDYLTSKEIKSNLIKKNGVNFLGVKVPDLILLKDDKKIAIESEITQKAKNRQKINLDKYKDDLSFNLYSLVIYVCETKAIKERLDKVIIEKEIEGLKTILFQEVIQNGK